MTPTLIVNPVTDREFVAAAEGFVASGAQTTGELETLLRVEYPRAVVHARDLSGEAITVWYVYRDGRWTNAQASG